MMILSLTCKFAVFLILALAVCSLPLPESTIQQIYFHPTMFEDNYHNAKPRDVGAFKYFCIHDHLSSIVNQYIEIFAVSDSI